MNTIKTKAEIIYYKSGLKEVTIRTIEGLIICTTYFDEISVTYDKDYNSFYIHTFIHYGSDRTLRDLTASIMVDSYEIIDL